MNKARRAEIAEVQGRVEELIENLTVAKGDLESIRDDEQDYLDNMPEAFQEGEKGEAAQAAIDALEEAIGAIEELTEAGVSGMLDTAAE